jgi:Leucine-rich repeat (LRR) protein
MTNTFQQVADLPVDFFNRLYNTGIRYLRADHNYLVKAKGMFFSDTLPPTLEYADFSNNELIEIWFNMPYLISLNLQNNSLGFFLAEYSYNNFTETSLKYLDLSFNGIYSLQYSIFQKHPQLETIKINDNILSDVTFDLSQLPRLQLLDLSSNKITAFSSQTIMDSISKSDMIINLSNNILLCNCQT